MEIELSEDGSIEPFQVDDKGRINIGKEFAGDRVRVAILRRLNSTGGVPAELPRFDGPVPKDDSTEEQTSTDRFSGLTGELDDSPSESARREPTRSERQAAMLNATDDSDPFWYGFGVENGVEVGTDPETHYQHVLVAGGDDDERTTALEHQWEQIVARDRGAILHLTDDVAMGRFIERVRDAGREDDLIELSPTSPSSRGLNILGFSDQQDEADAIQNTIGGLFQSASGSATLRIRQAVWNIVRQSDGQATLTDVYYVLATETGLKDPAHFQQNLISAERAEWLDETISETGLDDAAREAALHRLQQWIKNTAIRNGIAATNPLTSIPDALSEQKLIVIRGEHPSSIPNTMIAFAILFRARYSPNETRSDGTVEPYYVVSDDIEGLAEAGPFLDILRELRSHCMPVIAGCKGITGWDDSEAIMGQFGTHLTFAPRRSDAKACAALHSQNIDQRDLLNLSKGTGYLRTQNGSLVLGSIKVETFDD